MVLEAVQEEEPDNPIYRVVKSLIMHEVVSAKSDDVQTYILNRLEELSVQMNRMFGKIREPLSNELKRSYSSTIEVISDNFDLDSDKIVNTIIENSEILRVAKRKPLKDGRLLFDIEFESKNEYKRAVEALIGSGYEVNPRMN